VALKLVKIESVKWLAKFMKNVIRDVSDIID